MPHQGRRDRPRRNVAERRGAERSQPERRARTPPRSTRSRPASRRLQRRPETRPAAPEGRQDRGAEHRPPGGNEEQQAATTGPGADWAGCYAVPARRCSSRTEGPEPPRGCRRAPDGADEQPFQPPPSRCGLPSWSPMTGNCRSADPSTCCCSAGCPPARFPARWPAATAGETAIRRRSRRSALPGNHPSRRSTCNRRPAETRRRMPLLKAVQAIGDSIGIARS